MKILIVEDEAKLGAAIKRGLQQENYVVDWVQTAEEGLNYTEADTYDVIILDRMLPGGRDGLEICQSLRRNGNQTPVLMLTARGTIADRVTGLKDGADDYLVKPFAFSELLARIQALLRRPAAMVGPFLKVADLTINTSEKTVTRGDERLPLSKREYSLLEYLAHNQNHVVTKDQIIDHVWSYDDDILPNTVEVFIASLRKKLGDKSRDSIIETVRGFGYRLKNEAS